MTIHIKNLEAKTILGVYDNERRAPRTVIINVSIDYDHNLAAASDRMEDALDYEVIEETIVTSLKEQQFRLLEALAEHIANVVMGFVQIREVTVEVDKPGALKHAQSVSVMHTVKRNISDGAA